jgi:dihydropteroate synthase
LASNVELESAFDAAMAQARKCIKRGMMAVGGESAVPYLEKLENELKLERAKALERGAVDREWFQKTVRSLIEWAPETEAALIAALGRIARAGPIAPS